MLKTLGFTVLRDIKVTISQVNIRALCNLSGY